MAAEFFDDKLLSIGYAVFGTLENQKLDIWRIRLPWICHQCCSFRFNHRYLEWEGSLGCRSSILCHSVPLRRLPNHSLWRQRLVLLKCTCLIDFKFDLFSGQGTVNDIPASDWASYMPVADHPEYPSTTAGICAAHAEASRQLLGSDDTLLEPVPFVQGNSRREFGITPARNTSINLATWTDFELTCGSSRLWGGVHFVDAVEEGNRIGNEIGKLVVDFCQAPYQSKPSRSCGSSVRLWGRCSNPSGVIVSFHHRLDWTSSCPWLASQGGSSPPRSPISCPAIPISLPLPNVARNIPIPTNIPVMENNFADTHL